MQFLNLLMYFCSSCIAQCFKANSLPNIPAKDPKRKTLAKDLEEDENILNQCIDKLKVVEANRLALVSQLRDALNEQVTFGLLF